MTEEELSKITDSITDDYEIHDNYRGRIDKMWIECREQDENKRCSLVNRLLLRPVANGVLEPDGTPRTFSDVTITGNCDLIVSFRRGVPEELRTYVDIAIPSDNFYK